MKEGTRPAAILASEQVLEGGPRSATGLDGEAGVHGLEGRDTPSQAMERQTQSGMIKGKSVNKEKCEKCKSKDKSRLRL